MGVFADLILHNLYSMKARLISTRTQALLAILLSATVVTAQAGKQTAAGVGQIAGAILGSIVGGTWGQVISQGTQFGIGTYFLKFSREYEQQADLEGCQIMARAGYDPRDMGNMFKTIEKQ